MTPRLGVAAAVVLLSIACGSSATQAPALDFRVAASRLAQDDIAFHIYVLMSDAWTSGRATEHDVLRAATRGRRAVYFLELADGEINNGGLNQFFWNSSGDFARETIDAARRVGAQRQEALLRLAAGIFPSGLPPRNRTRRQGELDALPVSKSDVYLGMLDDRWFAADGALRARLDAYVRSHPREFAR